MTETIQIWSGEAELYADTRPAPPAILLDICTQLVQTPHPALVVDLGSGTGLSTVFWIERVQQVIGIEPNADMRLQAAQHAAAFPHPERVRYQDGLSTQNGFLTEQEVGLARLKRIAQDVIGSEPIPWYFSYRVRIGIK